MDHYDSEAGTINPYFAEKYGINPDALILTGTGDNPATLMDCGGNIVVSLGSSYTVNGVMDKIVPSAYGEYNLFGYTKGRAMALSVITNGGKELKGFKRISLNPGESKKVTFSMSSDMLAFTGKDYKKVIEPGEIEVMIGASSEDIRLESSFILTGEARYPGKDRKLVTDVIVEDVF